jgi:hypothetical protein
MLIKAPVPIVLDDCEAPVFEVDVDVPIDATCGVFIMLEIEALELVNCDGITIVSETEIICELVALVC